MKWVYSIAFLDERFVMVFNPTRGGWEMPGGRVEDGEDDEKAAVREVREECGCVLVPYAQKKHRDGLVFVGNLECPIDKAEMDWALFSQLPKELAFPDEEYQELLAWARAERNKWTDGRTRFRSELD